jgi:hypothetical protein
MPLDVFNFKTFKTCSPRYKGINLNYSTTIPKQAKKKGLRGGGGAKGEGGQRSKMTSKGQISITWFLHPSNN